MDNHDYDFMDEIIDRVRRETAEQIHRELVEQIRREYTLEFAKKLLTVNELIIEDIAECCNLPIETVRKLAANK